MKWIFSSSFAADSSRQLDILRHYRDAFRVDRAQIRVLEQTDEICLARLLQRCYRCCLEAKFGLEVLRYLTNESLEGELADEELGALLIFADFA